MKNIIKAFISVLSLYIGLSSCEKPKETPETINGVWKSLGSGWVLQIQDSTEYTLFDVTKISCLENRTAELSEMIPDLQLQNDTLSLIKGVMTYRFVRDEKALENCSTEYSTEQRKNTLFNFEIFAETVSEHYAFFELNQIQWDSLYTAHKNKVVKDSSEVNLYQVIDETLALLNDNHAYLEATDDLYEAMEAQETEEVLEESSEERLPKYGDLQIAGMVAKNHLEEELTEGSKLIRWGKMKENLGYVQIMTMWLHADLDIPQTLIDQNGYVDAYVETFHNMYEGDYIKREAKAVTNIMEKVMNDLRNVDAIVLDVRFNGGGQDAVSYAILKHFVGEKAHVANQKLRYGKQFSSPLKLFLEGGTKPFLKPVYVLTSQQTGSAAEAFSMATLSLQHFKRIGAATSGAMSTALEKTLPNGWSFAISNEINLDLEGNVYENIGIPVDYDLQYPKERQDFFRQVAQNLEADKETILSAIEALKQP
ncbi:MAG: S41 family peptidase [Bacteroidota bacterium]